MAEILQASALERQGKIVEALETLDHARRKTAKGKRGDLLAYIGYLHSRRAPPDFELSRRACREAFNDACFKPRLFETWFGAEWELGNFPGTEEVARVALDKSIEPIFEWRIRLAAALSSKAHAQSGGRISVSVLPAYLEASKELSEAIGLAPSDEARKWRSNLEDINDNVYLASLEAVATPLDRLAVIRHLTIFVRQGDWRIRNYARVLGLFEEILTITGKKSTIHSGQVTATRSAFDDFRHLLSQRVERFPNDERHEALCVRCDLLRAQFSSSKLPERAREVTPRDLENDEQMARSLSSSRQEHSLDGVIVSSTNIEICRPMLPDHLSTDKSSPYYVSECFKFEIGILLNGKERFDVNEYCISEGWVKVPSGKTVDRRGKPLLIKLKGTVESFYRDSSGAGQQLRPKAVP